jgi:uncharacterized protein
VPETSGKSCLVVVDAPRGPLLCPLTLPPQATVSEALAEARRRIDDGTLDPPVDWEAAAVGIWGSRCSRSTVPRDGDRIELYRELPADPRQRRRQRAGSTTKRDGGTGRGS